MQATSEVGYPEKYMLPSHFDPETDIFDKNSINDEKQNITIPNMSIEQSRASNPEDTDENSEEQQPSKSS